MNRAEIERWKKIQEADGLERKRRRKIIKHHRKPDAPSIPDYEWVQCVPRFKVEEGGKVIPDGHNPDGSLKYKLYKAELIDYLKLDGRDFYGIPKEEKEVESNGAENREPDTPGYPDKESRERRLGNLQVHNLRVAKTRLTLLKTGR